MAQIATFVFLYLETTGLPKEELNQTRITELSLVAVKRAHILDTPSGQSPRVQQKLTLCLNPRRTVQPGSTQVTGLCNDLLEHEPTFNQAVFDIINGFLSVLTEPVCLIAHNGMTYDYPILKKHLIDQNVNFSDSIVCADCLYFFYDTGSKTSVVSLDKISGVEDNVVDNVSFSEGKEGMQKLNELTPKNSLTTNTEPRRGSVKHKFDTNPLKLEKARRRTYFGNDPKPKDSYKLACLYERLLNRPASGAHRAENDCVMAMECAVAKAQEFVQWVDRNHCLLADIKPMTVGEPLGY